MKKTTDIIEEKFINDIANGLDQSENIGRSILDIGSKCFISAIDEL